jgi:hypothetical protein
MGGWARVNRILVDVPSETAPAPGDPIMSGANPAGESLAANARYLLVNGRPWFPIAGELHYWRFPEACWDDSILKIRAGGVGIIATYAFWIHHEEIEGRYDCEALALVRLECATAQLLCRIEHQGEVPRIGVHAGSGCSH